MICEIIETELSIIFGEVKNYKLGARCSRLRILVPFQLTISLGAEFELYHFAEAGYDICIFPPQVDGSKKSEGEPEQKLTIDGKEAVQASILWFDFRADTFDRSRSIECDPSYALISKVINSFLRKLRYVAKAPQIREIDFPGLVWQLQYLNDDGSELEKIEGFVRGRGAFQFGISWVITDENLWKSVHSLPADFEAPPWYGLLLDASEELPAVGPALTLAATALEVFVSFILSRLSERHGTNTDLANWIEEKARVEDRFDTLLKVYIGHSLKEEAALWEKFMKLKAARNSFVHSGTAKINGNIVTKELARELGV